MTTYYIATTGSNSNPGTEASPWGDLHAVDSNGLAYGDIVIVKDGAYNCFQSGLPWYIPAINVPSGVTVKAQNKHGAKLYGYQSGDSTRSIIGGYGKSGIVIDGFEIYRSGGSYLRIGVSFHESSDCTVKDCKIHGMRWSTGDNTEGVEFSRTTGGHAHNNEIYDIGHFEHWNFSGVKLYNSRNIIVEHNYIHDNPGCGIYDKDGHQNNIHRYNFISGSMYGFYWNSQSTTTTLHVYQNIIKNCTHAVGANNDTIGDTKNIYNNVFYNVRCGFRAYAAGPWLNNKIKWYNNITYKNPSYSGLGDTVNTFNYKDWYHTDDAPRTIFTLVEYNIYATTPKYAIPDGTVRSLAYVRANWGWDDYAQVGSLLFTNPAANDFTLQASSPAQGAGRVGGVASGAVVDCGCYITGNEVIGITTGDPEPTPNPGANEATAGLGVTTSVPLAITAYREGEASLQTGISDTAAPFMTGTNVVATPFDSAAYPRDVVIGEATATNIVAVGHPRVVGARPNTYTGEPLFVNVVNARFDSPVHGTTDGYAPSYTYTPPPLSIRTGASTMQAYSIKTEMGIWERVTRVTTTWSR